MSDGSSRNRGPGAVSQGAVPTADPTKGAVMAASQVHLRVPLASLAGSICGWRVVALAAALLIGVPAGASAATPVSIARYYNALRSANGIPGDLSVDEARSADCALHNHYAALNGNDRPDPHQETPGKPGYTAGGDWAAHNSELAGGSGLVSAWPKLAGGRPNWSVPFLGDPFHLMGLLNPANTTIWGADSERGLCVGEAGARLQPVSDTLYSFPGTGTTVPWAEPYPNEYPTSPEAIAGIAAGTVSGPALMAYWRGPSDANDPPLDTLSAASLTGPSGPVPVDIVGSSQSSLVPSGAGFVIPVAPLRPGRAYTASVTFSTAAGQPVQRSWTQSFNFTATGPAPAATLVHIAAISRPKHGLNFVMTADFPAAGQPATLKVSASNKLLRIAGANGNLPGLGLENVYPLAAPEPGGWVKLALTVPAYTVGGVRLPATTVSRTVHGPPLSSLLTGFAPQRTYSSSSIGRAGIVVSLHVTQPGTRLQAALKRGSQVYAFSQPVTAVRGKPVELVLRPPAALLNDLLRARPSATMTLALRIAQPAAQQFEIDRTVTITR